VHIGFFWAPLTFFRSDIKMNFAETSDRGKRPSTRRPPGANRWNYLLTQELFQALRRRAGHK
jgi:hypothetical protein